MEPLLEDALNEIRQLEDIVASERNRRVNAETALAHLVMKSQMLVHALRITSPKSCQAWLNNLVPLKRFQQLLNDLKQ